MYIDEYCNEFGGTFFRENRIDRWDICDKSMVLNFGASLRAGVCAAHMDQYGHAGPKKYKKESKINYKIENDIKLVKIIF